MRRIPWTVIPGAVITLILQLCPAGAITIERVVAVVNEEVITLTELQEERQATAAGLVGTREGPALAESAESERRILEGLIDRRLLLQQVSREGIRVEAAEVSAGVEDFKSRNGLADDAALAAALRREALTLPQFRRRLQDQMAIGKLLARRVSATVILTEEELQTYYRTHLPEFSSPPQLQLRHLLIEVPKGGDPDGEAAAANRTAEALTALMGGAPFAAVAARYSDGATAAQGGELGVLRQGELAPELERVAFALIPGEMSMPIRTAAGYNILLVEARETPVVSFAQARDKIRDRLFQQKAQKRFQDYLAELRSKAYVEIKLP